MKRVLLSIFFIFSLATVGFSAQNLTPAQLQMIKSAGYGNYLDKLKKDAAKNVDDVEKVQVVENNISSEKKDIDIHIDKQIPKNILKEKEELTLSNINSYKKSDIPTQKLLRYGASFFNNKNSFNPYSVPTPDSYVLTKGDKLSIVVYGIENGKFDSKVNREGVVMIDRVGKIKLAGLKFDDAKEELEKKIREAFPTATDIDISISKFAPIQIIISGLVKAPGLYNLTSFSSIKDALLTSGGILENGSYRDIELKRGGKVVKVFDLYKLIRYGDDSSDIMLQNGDIVVVKPAQKNIKLFGEVNIPAIYELKDGENFLSLIKYASGMKPSADQHNVRLKRYNKNREIKVSSIALVQLYKMLPKDGDEVTIFKISPHMAKSVFFEGNVALQGEMELPKSRRLSSLFKKALHKFGKKGFFGFNTDYSFGILIYSDHIKSFNLQKVLKGKQDVKLYGGEKIHIFKRDDLKSNEYIYARGDIVDPKKRKYNYINGMTVRDLFHIVEFQRVNSDKKSIISPAPKVKILRVSNGKNQSISVDIRVNPTFKLQPYDDVEFYDLDKVVSSNKVEISGEVYIPGEYNIDGKYTTINRIIKLAGGLTKKALLQKCEIARYRVEGDERVREVYNISLEDALAKHYKIQRDDEVKIFPISNWSDKKYVVLKGEVKYPGRYAINTGEKLASVIKRAGGLTENAFVEGAVFTRGSVKKLQEEQVKESLSKLKNRALALQSKGASVGEDEGAKERMLLSIKELEKKASELKPIGRVSINLYHDLDRFENSQYNITLKDGDALTIPEMTDTVTVIGQVLNQNTFVYDKSLSADDYIEKAGGLDQSADDDHIYIVKANGEAFNYKKSFFKANSEIFKGDTIVVPLKLDAISNLKFTKDISDILYKLAVTAASLKTVGAL